jgi:hypothetical protein
VGFGVKKGQASQINNNEGFVAQNAAFTSGDANEINGLKFDISGIGNIKSVNVEYWLVDDGVVVESHTVEDFALPSGNKSATFTAIHSATSFDQVYVRFFFDGSPTNEGVRLLNFAIETPKPVPDQTFDFGLKITDKDGDSAPAPTNFLIGVDGSDPDHTVAGIVV